MSLSKIECSTAVLKSDDAPLKRVCAALGGLRA